MKPVPVTVNGKPVDPTKATTIWIKRKPTKKDDKPIHVDFTDMGCPWL
jgi:hypothetical protein